MGSTFYFGYFIHIYLYIYLPNYKYLNSMMMFLESVFIVVKGCVKISFSIILIEYSIY